MVKPTIQQQKFPRVVFATALEKKNKLTVFGGHGNKIKEEGVLKGTVRPQLTFPLLIHIQLHTYR